MDNRQRLREIFSDEAFVKHLFDQETPEDAQKVLEEKDVIVTIDQIVKYKELLEKHVNGEINLEEMSEKDLEEITGGLITEGLLVIGGLLAFTGLMLTGGAAYLVNEEKRRRGRRW